MNPLNFITLLSEFLDLYYDNNNNTLALLCCVNEVVPGATSSPISNYCPKLQFVVCRVRVDSSQRRCGRVKGGRTIKMKTIFVRTTAQEEIMEVGCPGRDATPSARRCITI